MLKKERYNIMLNPNYMLILEKYSDRMCVSRSYLINEILKEFIEEKGLNTNGINYDVMDGQLEVENW